MMISQKEGGEYGARCMARVGVLAVRGSTSSLSRTGRIRDKKGREALAAMVGLVRDEGFHAGHYRGWGQGAGPVPSRGAP